MSRVTKKKKPAGYMVRCLCLAYEPVLGGHCVCGHDEADHLPSAGCISEPPRAAKGGGK